MVLVENLFSRKNSIMEPELVFMESAKTYLVAYAIPLEDLESENSEIQKQSRAVISVESMYRPLLEAGEDHSVYDVGTTWRA
ncbi:hypothetical protein NC653_032195 [Populus alba x Populus x berolinensis]|uniref:Uncharacterized protein n=1 Tax=Populus alba x Populus x berolinensis TaxID=444605 RepID=A0AAD6LQS4_9ROSI|nr:hypothetical protein NC653_032195 [Populus alba x Populus x berolinensis]